MNCPSEPLVALKSRLHNFDAHFIQAVDNSATDSQLNAALNYAALGGGKRVRPYIVLSIGAALNVPEAQLLPAAIAVEMVHAYSLVHDDLPAMDDDDLRRGRPTVHRAFDEAIAILAGDALLTEAFGVLSCADPLPMEKRVQLIALLARCAGARGMVAGQAKDIAAEGAAAIVQQDLVEIQLLKTGAIFDYCVSAPAILANSVQDVQQALSAFGRYLGTLFQLSDDVIGATVAAEVSGKPQDSDARNNKTNFVRLHGVAAAQAECQNLANCAKTSLQQAGIDNDELQQFLDWIAVRDR